MRIKDFFHKDLITYPAGRNLGRIYDLDIGFSPEHGGIEVLIFYSRSGIFKKEQVKISWEQIQTMGEDVIILKL